MENFINEDILIRYPPCLRTIVQEICTHGQIGVSSMYIQINLPQSKLDFDFDVDYGNSFILNIPYAGKNLQWEVLFNDEDPTSAPDFEILNDTFLTNPDINTISDHLPTLANWNVKDSKSLINVVREMLILYKKYQIEKLENEPKFKGIQDEYRRIKHELNISDDDIEIYVENNTLIILVALKLNFSNLPIYIQESYFQENSLLLNPGIDSATLKISFITNRVTSSLQLSPHIEKVFTDYTTLSIPPYKKGADMAQYIQSIHDLIEDSISEIKEHFKLKEEYFSILLSLKGLNVVEYDNINFSKGLFLFEVDNFYFMVHISIGKKFPQERPSVYFKSVYHKNSKGEPIVLKINNYNYSAKWKPEEMIKQMLKHIQEFLSKFQMYCNQNMN